MLLRQFNKFLLRKPSSITIAKKNTFSHNIDKNNIHSSNELYFSKLDKINDNLEKIHQTLLLQLLTTGVLLYSTTYKK